MRTKRNKKRLDRFAKCFKASRTLLTWIYQDEPQEGYSSLEEYIKDHIITYVYRSKQFLIIPKKDPGSWISWNI